MYFRNYKIWKMDNYYKVRTLMVILSHFPQIEQHCDAIHCDSSATSHDRHLGQNIARKWRGGSSSQIEDLICIYETVLDADNLDKFQIRAL